ncbi:hypothetical protein LX81_04402 [Palleronia aestuarii]|uniref:Uncharacterized protein n=1 Tax=Palleronia aestuarii TaxID=568105 RepID=A0A2W7MMX1_9RHOB|nr:hypothetical protein LX81_04402 [Palleronia aestuarii]
MTDTSVKKVSLEGSPEGEMGQRYLVTGTKLGMRLWNEATPAATRRSAT